MNCRNLLVYRVINHRRTEAWEPLAKQYCLHAANDLRRAVALLRQVPIACIITEVPQTRAVPVDELRYLRLNFQTIPLAVCGLSDSPDLIGEEIDGQGSVLRVIPPAAGRPLTEEISSLVEDHSYSVDFSVFGIAPKPYPARIKHALEMIRREFLHKELTVAQIATRLNVHRCHLDREFLRYCRIPPKQLILGLRLLIAVFLMKNEGLKLFHVAQLAGFPDYFEFCKLFRRHMGMPPSQFRQAHVFEDFSIHYRASSSRRANA
ncbi:helix-turn-helix transcriptional regulator [candidate division KSB1 bacterium]|nr:AraC family transcriptional regulator [bacterium]NUM68573.1 helix-turn-helix transcriptional regulator [candidate division KSB1 bacterium]